MASEFKDSPPHVKAALNGLTRLSRTIASRDAELKRLLASANAVSGTVAERNKALETLIKDADLLMAELDARREAIHTLFTNTSAMAQQVTALVRENRAELKPALDQLTKVLAVLEKHEKDLATPSRRWRRSPAVLQRPGQAAGSTPTSPTSRSPWAPRGK